MTAPAHRELVNYLSCAIGEVSAAINAAAVFHHQLGDDPASAGQRAIAAIDDAISTLRDARDMVSRRMAQEPAAAPVVPAQPEVDDEPPSTGDPLVDEAIASLRGCILGGSLTRSRAAELAAEWPAETRDQLSDEQFERVLSAFPTEARVGGHR